MVRCTATATALLCATSSVLASSELVERKSNPKCIPCNPSGWKSKSGPAIGSNMAPLYVNLVQSVKTIRFRRDTTLVENVFQQHKRASAPICCTDGAQCVLLSKFLIPFCYDKYTTNFLFPDSSKGNIANGTYYTNASPPDIINLISGNVTSANTSNNGTNIYNGDASSEKPNTSTLPIPPVYTAAGDGTIITNLGSIMTITGPTTIPATTRAATTIPATTGSDGVVTPARILAATTIPAITVAAVQSRAAAAHLRARGRGSSNPLVAGLGDQGDGLTLERVVMLYMGMMGVFGGMVMIA